MTVGDGRTGVSVLVTAVLYRSLLVDTSTAKVKQSGREPTPSQRLNCIPIHGRYHRSLPLLPRLPPRSVGDVIRRPPPLPSPVSKLQLILRLVFNFLFGWICKKKAKKLTDEQEQQPGKNKLHRILAP